MHEMHTQAGKILTYKINLLKKYQDVFNLGHKNNIYVAECKSINLKHYQIFFFKFSLWFSRMYFADDNIIQQCQRSGHVGLEQ